MNFRVFLLIGAVGAFGALWSSDGRYQANQIAMVRAERARSANATAVFVAKIQAEMTRLSGQFALKVADAARTASPNRTAKAPAKPAPISQERDARIAPDALFDRLVVAWVFNLDPGNGVGVLTGQATAAKAHFEERYCLLRFRTREAAFFASRRAIAYLRTQMSTPQVPDRMARVIIREAPIKETQARAAGNQTR
jgi:hypothetical protein